ncbi:fatty acid synthase-like [Schistocerca americana]|uniref:fatty acid synthase-like n=1 Tax=Schistocerca americana TaxID=7009 RepID=UPI001F4F779F|nr:fatty acid synthase-like [Schistocerca americana]
MGTPEKPTVVISGMSGRFPGCDSVEELKEKLYSGENMVTAGGCRWGSGLWGEEPHTGKLNSLSHFDAEFFNLPPAIADKMDPQARIMTEVVCEAIIDAGVNPLTLRGSRTGVFVGLCFCDSEFYWFSGLHLFNKTGGLHSFRSLLANRISYIFDFKGPSIMIDTACSSSIYALEKATSSFYDGTCDAAVIVGCNLLLNPLTSSMLQLINATNKRGCCCSFDEAADGYVRSEAVAAIFLQKSDIARRHYAEIVHIGINTDGHKTTSMSYPSREMQSRLLEETYRSASIDPASVDYIEAHGTGTKAGDPEELGALSDVFLKNRPSPLLIGSVKSNMGHAEGASGMCSIIKSLLILESNEIPPNLHYNKPNPKVPALSDGRLKVVAKRLHFHGNLIGINSFGLGGSNAHVILRRPQTAQRKDCYIFPLTKVICLSGRSQMAVKTLLSKLQDENKNHAFQALIQEIHSVNIIRHDWRGYMVMNPNGSSLQDVCNKHRKSVWFIFSGLGSQWPAAGRIFLQLSVLKDIIRQCAESLYPFKIDLFEILQDEQNDIYTNHTKAFISIVTIQICLVTLLRAVGVQPDGIIGHSLGEIAAGFADGCLTAQQAVLSAYYRAEAIRSMEFSGGAMLSAGISAEEAKDIIHPCVDIACHNSSSHIALSGPSSDIMMLKKKLSRQNVIVKEIESGGVAFHSRYIKSAEHVLLQNMKKVIPKSRKRSEKWISSSVHKNEWDSSFAKECSAEYLTHNMMSPVLFSDAVSMIPHNAFVIEIAPQGILQGVMRGALPTSVSTASTMSRNDNSLLQYSLVLGRLYLSGSQICLTKLYPRIQYPVPTGTPQISSLVKWNHDREWFVPVFSDKDWLNKHYHTYEIDLNKPEDEWYGGHTIDGRIIFPASGYLVLAWKTLAAHKSIKYEKLPVLFQNVHFQRASIFPSTGKLTFSVEILFTEGQFVICESDEIVVSGHIFVCQEPDKEFIAMNNASQTSQQSAVPLLKSKDVYLDLHLQGYQYTGVFKGILELDDSGAKVCFTKNWVALMDTVLQVALMKSAWRYFSHVCVPTKLRKVVINPEKICQAGDAVFVIVDEALKTVGCEGMQFSDAETAAIPRRSPNEQPSCSYKNFVPYHNFLTDTFTALGICLQIFIENCVKQVNIKTAVFSDNDKVKYTSAVSKWFSENPWMMVKQYLISETNSAEVDTKLGSEITVCNKPTINDFDLVLTDTLDQKRRVAMKNDGFMILNSNSSSLPTEMKVLSKISSRDGTYIYLLQKEKTATPKLKTITITSDKQFSWVKDLKQCVEGGEHDILLISEDKISNGVVGAVNCLRKEPGGEKIRCLVLLDSDVPKFDPNLPFYNNQLALGLAVNVYKDRCWGSYRYTLQPPEPLSVMTEYAYMNIQNPGNLSSLYWVQAEPPLMSNTADFPETYFSVYYSALNFKDIMMASGKLPINVLPEKLSEQNSILGLEFSGKDKNGRRVMGLLPGQGLATNVIAENVYDVPQSWSLEDAATVPVVYTTAYYALIIRGRLKHGETVLIHAGSGGVGQAAISIALHMNCIVYTTVSNHHKKQTLRSIFPQLKECNFANSRDTSFEQHILQQTQGRGVDLVLNSLSGDKLQASVRCVAEYGRFIEIGQYDLYTDKQLGLGVFLKNISFHGVRLDLLFGSHHDDEIYQLKKLMEEGLRTGVVKPLPRKVFSRNQAEDAFRYMAGAHHIGKVLLCIREEEKHNESKVSQPLRVQAKPRISFSPSAVCIVTGGLGGVGLQLSNWLVSRGLQQLVITSRRGACTAYQQHCVERWRKKGVTVHIAVDNMCTSDGTKSIVAQANKMGTVIGIFHLAAVIRDGFLYNQSVETFREVWEPKYTGAHWLDMESRTLCPGLKYFVVFSSVAAGCAMPGQSNYAFANCAVERLVEYRRESGLPGLAIQWGPIADVGLAADLEFRFGVKHQTIASCMMELEKLMLNHEESVARCILITKDTGISIRGHQRNDKLLTNITKILGLPDISSLSPDITLESLGMDSLMQIEIRLCIEQYFGKSLSAEEARSLTIQNLLDFERAHTSDLSGRASSVTEAETPENMNHFQMERTDEIPSNAAEKQFVLLDFSVSPLVPEETLVVLADEPCHQALPIFFVHPIDGTCRLLKETAHSMKRTVYGLQFSYESPRTTFMELATFYVRQMHAVQSTGPYILLGYSAGGAISFEMARQMEAVGETVLLIILDFLPNPLETGFSTLLTLEVGLLTQIVSHFLSKLDEEKLKSKLFSLPDWCARLEYCLHLVGPHHPKDLQSALENCYWLMKAINEYRIPSDRVVKAPLLLVAATDGIIKLRINKRYNFQKLTTGPFDIKYVEGNHTTFLQGPERCKAVADNINEWLEEHKSLLPDGF